MTPDERQMLGGLFQRVNSAAAAPRDAEAEAFINDAVRAAPHAPYVLSQTVLVQQQALEAAAHRIAELEAAGRQGAEQGQEQGSFLGNLGRIFGGGAAPAPSQPGYDPQAYQRAPAPPPPRGYASPPPQGGYPAPPPQGYPPQQPGPWGQPQPSGGGGGFLQNAASTAAGVAGGVALGNLLGGLFGGHSGGGLFGGGLGGAGLGGSGLSGNPTEVTEINNYYDGAQGDRPSDADFQGFDPGAPGVQDANFDQLDDSNFDNSDGSSFDDSGGGFDDV